jgi:hypothetical protein
VLVKSSYIFGEMFALVQVYHHDSVSLQLAAGSAHTHAKPPRLLSRKQNLNEALLQQRESISLYPKPLKPHHDDKPWSATGEERRGVGAGFAVARGEGGLVAVVL